MQQSSEMMVIIKILQIVKRDKEEVLWIYWIRTYRAGVGACSRISL